MSVGLVILVILGFSLWLIFKILQGLGNAVSDTITWFEEAAAQRRLRRYDVRKLELLAFVKFTVPEKPISLEKELVSTRTRLLSFREKNKPPSPDPPTWRKQPFKKIQFCSQKEGSGPLLISDLQLILTPNHTTWTQEESLLLRQSCEYPYKFFEKSDDDFEYEEFPPIQYDLPKAVFSVEQDRVKPEDVQQFFAAESARANEYNLERKTLLLRAEELNDRIRSCNSKIKSEWEKYDTLKKRVRDESFEEYEIFRSKYMSLCTAEKETIQKNLAEYRKGTKKGIVGLIDSVVGRLDLPNSIPRLWRADFDEVENIAIVEMKLPDVIHNAPMKMTALKSGTSLKPLNQTEKKETVPSFHPAILLRVAYEIARNDIREKIKALAVNGWVTFNDPSTGQPKQVYTASLLVQRDQLLGLALDKIDPLSAFAGLKGKSAGRLVEIVPITPSLSLNRKDSRFVDAKEVLNTLGTETNLASMDWQDFEHLIRELFEKEFAKDGVEVKITQASRDRGVDAVVFDPDPIRGGKFVIQAKRYTNVVDVSAVRDLCAVVTKEGASRGILVTTSTYGADAYTFAEGAPITLLNGSELLGLLEKHGYSFRIILVEARKLARSSGLQ
jgi:hypothetical protein